MVSGLATQIGQVSYVAANMLATAVSSAGSGNIKLVLVEAQTLTASVVVPSNIALDISNGGVISLAGYTLTINGPLIAGPYQIFTGTGTVVLSAAAASENVRPEWFGALSTGTAAANTTAINSAIAAISGAGGVVLVSHGITHNALTVPSGVGITVLDNSVSTTIAANDANPALTVTQNGSGGGINIGNATTNGVIDPLGNAKFSTVGDVSAISPYIAFVSNVMRFISRSSGMTPVMLVGSASQSADLLQANIAYGASIANITAKGIVSGQMGTSGTLAPTVGVANIQAPVGGVGNTAGTLTTLFTYSLPANALDVAGKALRIKIAGTFAANSDTKTLNLLFGSTTLLTVGPTSINGVYWGLDATIIKTGASTQTYMASLDTGNLLIAGTPTNGTSAQNDTAAITIAIQGNGSGASDVVANAFIVEYLS